MYKVRPAEPNDAFQPFQNVLVLSRPRHKQPFQTENEIVTGIIRRYGIIFYTIMCEFFLFLPGGKECYFQRDISLDGLFKR